MSQQDQENVGMEVDNKMKSRRKFLVKASAGAVVATLPAKAVWATGTAGSITASGHGSDFAQNHPIKIKDSHFWLSNAGTYDIEQEYYHISGGRWPMVHDKLKVLLKSQTKKLRLCHLMGSTDAVRALLQELYATEIANKEGPIYFDNHVERVKWTYSGSTIDKSLETVANWLKGWDDRNEVIANAYLSAVNSSNHPNATIYYPVLRTTGGNGTITSPTILMQKLHDAAKHDRLNFVAEFASLTS